MAPAWKQLAEDYEDSTVILIAEVDCTVEEDLCVSHDVEGYPTLLWGDPSELSDYSGQRDYETLKEFIEENLNKEICSFVNPQFCSQEEKDVIAALEKKSAEELDKLVQEYETEAEEADALFQAEVERFEEMYAAASKEFDEKLESLKKEKNYKHVKALLAKKNLDEQKDEL
jgi:protein disulfide-isomerase A6